MNQDIDYAAVFGINKGENEKEPADPSTVDVTDAEGENEEESADLPVDDMAEEDGTDTSDAEEEADDTPASKREQTKEERAQYAAARRRAEAERDEAIKKAKEDADKLVDEAFRLSGLTNPYTGEAIRTKAEFDAYKAQMESDRKKAFMESAGMSEKEYEEMISSLPEVKEARAAKAAAEEAGKAAKRAEAEQKIQTELSEIRKYDPSVTDLASLTKTDRYEEVYEYVKKGYGISDAYKLVHLEDIRSAAATGARQNAINATAGKAHMEKTTQRGAGSQPVPADIKAMYKQLNPEATEAEIQAHYNKHLKR